MDSKAIHTFNQALLDLDTALRPILAKRQQAEPRDAYSGFLRSIAPVRMQMAIAEHVAASPSGAGALELLGRCLAIAEQSGVSRTEIVALVNHETVEHAR